MRSERGKEREKKRDMERKRGSSGKPRGQHKGRHTVVGPPSLSRFDTAHCVRAVPGSAGHCLGLVCALILHGPRYEPPWHVILPTIVARTPKSMAADAGGWSNAAVLRKRRMREACIVGRTGRDKTVDGVSPVN